MGREITLFSSKETRSRTEVAGVLRDLASRIESGALTLSQGAEQIALALPEQVILELKVEDEEKRHKGVQHSLEVEIKWHDGMAPSGGLQLS